MLVVFTQIINASLLSEDPKLKRNIASLYADIYSAPPWNEQWTPDSALAELEEVMQKDSFTGIIRTIGSVLVAFSWGYKVPESNTSRVDFEKIRRELITIGLSADKTFYGADTGVMPEFRERGLGTLLVGERSKASPDCSNILFRTKNPAMVRIYRRSFGEELCSFPEESAYKSGRIYVFEVKK